MNSQDRKNVSRFCETRTETLKLSLAAASDLRTDHYYRLVFSQIGRHGILPFCKGEERQKSQLPARMDVVKYSGQNSHGLRHHWNPFVVDTSEVPFPDARRYFVNETEFHNVGHMRFGAAHNARHMPDSRMSLLGTRGLHRCSGRGRKD